MKFMEPYRHNQFPNVVVLLNAIKEMRRSSQKGKSSYTIIRLCRMA